MSEWIYDKELDISKFYGFVYLITRIDTGRMYVGRKYLTASGGKKKPRKGSNWEKYWGSCKVLLEEIQELGEDKFKREILSFQETRGQCNYAEVEEQIKRDVLKSKLPDGTRAYYNGNVLNRWFCARETPTQQTLERRAAAVEARRGVPRTEEVKAKIKAANKGKPGRIKTEEEKLKISKSKTGERKSLETRMNMSKARTKNIVLDPHQTRKTKSAKLTDEQVRAIRADTDAPRYVAEKYQMSPTAIRKIVKRETYGHVE